MSVREHHLAVSRTARYVTLGEPGPEVTEIWFACHGYGQLAKHFIKHFEPIAASHRLIVAPEALSRFYLETPNVPAKDRRVGATWMTREDRLAEIEDQVEYLDALYDTTLAGLDRQRIRVRALGFSQGVATVTRWLRHGKAAADEMILWAGSVPADLDLDGARSPFAAMRISLVLGTRDEYATWAALDEQRARFERIGIDARSLSFDGGHGIDAALLARLAEES